VENKYSEIAKSLTSSRRIEAIIDAGVVAVLIMTVLLVAMLLSIAHLNVGQPPIGLAHAIVYGHIATVETSTGDLTLELSLIGIVGATMLGAYYVLVHKSV